MKKYIALLLLMFVQISKAEEAIQPSFIYKAEVARVIDGDTISLNISLGFGVWIHGKSVRLLGVYAPESRTRDKAEKDNGLMVKDFLSKLIPSGSEIIVRTKKDGTDKYGRYLGDVWIGEISVNKSLNDFMEENGILPSGKGVKKE